MPSSDFTNYPVVRDHTIVNGIVIPGTFHTKAWWENELYAWIIRCMKSSEYPEITPADLIKLYMEQSQISVSASRIQGYVYSHSEYIQNSVDSRVLHIQGISLPFFINNVSYIYNGGQIDLSTYTTAITFTTANRYKKIGIGLVVLNDEFVISIQQSNLEHTTITSAKSDSTIFTGMLLLAEVIVQHSSTVSPVLNSTGLVPIIQNNIVNYGYHLSQMTSNYLQMVDIATTAKNITNSTNTVSKTGTEVIDHINNTSIHGDSQTLITHIANTTIHGDSQIVLDHIADETLHGGGGGNANIDDSSFASNVTWSADKISTELTQIGSDVSIQNEDKTIYVPQITDITCSKGIFIEDRGNNEVRINVESSITWESVSIISNTQIGVKKIFGRKGRLVRANLFLENEGSGVQQITFDILKNGVSILSEYIVCTSHLSTIIKDFLLEEINETDYFEFRCINDGGFPSSNVSCQLVII